MFSAVTLFLFTMIPLKVDSTSYLSAKVRRDYDISKKTTSVLSYFDVRNSYGISIEQNNQLLIKHAGVYSISITLTLQIESNEHISLMTSTNNNYANSNTLKSTSVESAGTLAISQNGLIKCGKLDEMSVFIHSKSGNMKILRASHLYIILVTDNNLFPGFSVSLLKDVKKTPTYDSQTKFKLAWTSIRLPMSYSQTNYFSYLSNYFIVSKSGPYIFNGNIVIKNRKNEECYHSFKLIKNNFKTVFTVSEVTTSNKTLFTISFNHFTTLQKSDRLSVEVWTECLYTVILKESRFSMQYLEYDVFSSKLTTLEHFLLQKGWVDVNTRKFEDVANHSSKFMQPHANFWKVKKSGLYMVTINLLFMNPKSAEGVKLRISRQKNGTDGAFVAYVGKYLSSQVLLTITFIDYLLANENLKPMIYLPKSDRYLLAVNSSFSGMRIESSKFPNDVTDNINVDFASWKPLTVSVSASKFWYLEDSILRVTESGIYFVTCSFFLVARNSCRVRVSLISDYGDILKQKRFVTTIGHVTHDGRYITFASSLRINVLQKIGVYILPESSCEINVVSKFQIAYLGSRSIVIGFQANFLTEQNLRKKQILGNFYDSSRAKTSERFSFNTGNTFDHEKGVFVAPYNGIYVFSANVIFKRVMKNEIITIRVLINDQPTRVFEEKHATTDNFVHTFSITSSFELLKNDKLKVMTSCSGSKPYNIDKSSSLSIVYLNNFERTVTMTAERHENKVYQEKGFTRILGWVLTRQHSERNLNLHKTPQVEEEEFIQISVSGKYLISVNILHRSSYKSDAIILFIHIDKTEMSSDYKCFVETNFMKSMEMKCNFLLQLYKNDRISFRIKKHGTSRDIGESNEEKIDKFYQHGFLTLTLLHDPYVHQAGIVRLQKQPMLEISREYLILKHWHDLFTVSRNGDSGFSLLNGDLHARSSGWYFISAKLNYRKEFGNITISVANAKDLSNNFIQSIAAASLQIELQLAGIVFLNRSTKVAFNYRGFGPGSVLEKGALLNFCYLESSETETYTLVTSSRKQSKTSSKIESNIHEFEWQRNEKMFRSIEFERNGMYIVLTSINVKISGDKAKFLIVMSEQEESVIEFSSISNGFRTYLLTGVFPIQERKRNFRIHFSSKDKFQLSQDSKIYLSRISDTENNAFAKLRVTKNQQLDFWSGEMRIDLRVFEIKIIEDLFYDHGKVVVKYSGLYFISSHLIVECTTTNRISFGLHINEELIVESTRTCSAVDSLTIINTLNLKQGDVISLTAKSFQGGRITILSDSSFNVLILKRIGRDSTTMTPVITDELYRGSVLNLDGNSSASLECNAVPRDTDTEYQWYRNNKLLDGHTENVLSLHDSLGGSYQCQAIREGFGVISKPTRVNVMDIDECKTDQHSCHGDNVTCVNTRSSYYCACVNNVEYKNGKCNTEPEKSLADAPPKVTKSKLVTTLLLILIPIGTFFCLMMLGITFCLYIRHRERREDDEAVALANYDEENMEDIPMHDMDSSDDRDIDRVITRDNASIATSHSYTPSNMFNQSEDEDDIAGFEEHKWKKLNATTSV